MTEEMKKCPYCKEEIPEDVKVCPICGETIQKPNSFKINIGAKVFIIIGLVLLIAWGFFGVSTAKANEIKEAYTVIPLYEANSSQDSNMTAKKALDIINEQGEKVKSYIEDKHFQDSKDIVFSIYYQNILHCISILESRTVLELDIYNPKLLNNQYATISGVTFKPTFYTDDNGYKSLGTVTISNPEAPYIVFDCDEGVFVPSLNNEYLYKTYSSNLGEAWKQYFEFKLKNNDDISYKERSINMVDEIILLQKFIKKYPSFATLKEVQKEIKMDTGILMLNTENYYYAFTFEDNVMSPIAKQMYEKFLQEADHESKEYHAIERAYEIIKRHNYKYSEELNNYWNNYVNEMR